ARTVRPGDPEAARVEACFALIAVLEDTNLLHRGGSEGLHFAREAARRFLAEGGVVGPGWRERARAVHDSFVASRLSPGGSADLLAMTLFVDLQERTRA
ncbi:triphosphoribosyl-dephospho-CoA synthase, partial [Hansschlegelia beijingensis]